MMNNAFKNFHILFFGWGLIARLTLALLLGGAVGPGWWADAIAEGSALSASAQSVAASTAEFDDDLDYRDRRTCDALGGAHQQVNRREYVCSGIDKNDTFCIVDSSDAFPCDGLFKHVGLCNGKYNRPALNPFFCGKRCEEEGKFACGGSCARGEIAPSSGRIPYVAQGYSGEVFWVAAAMNVGKARIEAPAIGSALIARVVREGNAAIVSMPSPAAEGSEVAVTLRAGFSCAGLEQKFGARDFAFTVTTLPPQPIIRVVKKHLPSTADVSLTLDGFTNWYFEIFHGRHYQLFGNMLYLGEPSLTNLLTITARAISADREFLGALDVSVLVTFAGPPNAGKAPLSCRTPEYYTATRLAHGCVDSGCDLDVQLENAAGRGDVQTACSLITMGANVDYAAPVRGLSPRLPLFRAVQRGDAAMVSILAYNGADVNRRLVVGSVVNNAPLHALASHSVSSTLGAALEKIARILVENGADVNAKDARGNTYLYLVAVGGHVGGMRPILRAGADPNLPIVEERSIWDEGGGLVTIHRSLADFALTRASTNDRVAAVSILLDFKESAALNVDVVEKLQGLGALHLAKSVEVAELLLNAGANANLESAPQGTGHEAGLSPLDWMARQRQYPAVAELLYRQGGRCLKPEDDLEFCHWE